MKVMEYLESLPEGSIVGNKRVLALFKRLGFIADYSIWGYLESQEVYYIEKYIGDSHMDHIWSDCGPLIKEGEKGSYTNPFADDDEMHEAGYFQGLNEFEYKGYRFSYKYLDGCFCPYLQMVKAPTERKKINPRMSLWGAII